jgi:serine/threonine protein kinase
MTSYASHYNSRNNYYNNISTNNHKKVTQQHIGQFVIGKSLGEGTFGKVKLGTHILTGEKVAIKILEKVKILDEGDKIRVDREIRILKSMMHYNIIKIYSVIETPTTIYLIMEYASGGELFDYIVLKKRLQESEACKFFHQIINAIEYLHKLGIVHRDLKPENLLLDHKKDVKMVDFGLSNTYKQGDLLKTPCGSPCYAAPEMVMGKKYSGLLVDIWSSGIILFAMLCGFLPFDDANNDVLYKKIAEGRYSVPGFLSEPAKDIIKRILTTDPLKRFNIQQIREHAWFNIVSPSIINEGLFITQMKIPIDLRLVEKMSEFGFSKEEALEYISKNRHNHVTTTYYLLLKADVKNGISSVADLFSKDFIEFVKNPENQNNYRSKGGEIVNVIANYNSSTSYQSNMTSNRNETINRNYETDLYETARGEDKYVSAKTEHFDSKPIQTECNYETTSNNGYAKTEANVEKKDDMLPYKKINPNEAKRDSNRSERSERSSITSEIVGNYIRSSLKGNLKEQYEKYVKKNSTKNDNNEKEKFKKGFFDTSVSFENTQNEIKHRTFDLGKEETNLLTEQIIPNEDRLITEDNHTMNVPLKTSENFKSNIQRKDKYQVIGVQHNYYTYHHSRTQEETSQGGQAMKLKPIKNMDLRRTKKREPRFKFLSSKSPDAKAKGVNTSCPELVEEKVDNKTNHNSNNRSSNKTDIFIIKEDEEEAKLLESRRDILNIHYKKIPLSVYQNKSTIEKDSHSPYADKNIRSVSETKPRLDRSTVKEREKRDVNKFLLHNNRGANRDVSPMGTNKTREGNNKDRSKSNTSNNSKTIRKEDVNLANMKKLNIKFGNAINRIQVGAALMQNGNIFNSKIISTHSNSYRSNNKSSEIKTPTNNGNKNYIKSKTPTNISNILKNKANNNITVTPVNNKNRKTISHSMNREIPQAGVVINANILPTISNNNVVSEKDEIPYHHGVFDISCISFQTPSKLQEEILHSLSKVKVAFKPSVVRNKNNKITFLDK